MLPLASATDDAWVQRALAHLDEILLDHAHCEKKAASTAVSLLFRYPERMDLARPLSRLAREELVHYERVLACLARRGTALRHQRPGAYAAELLAAARGEEPARLLDTLLCMALIEARSCERLALLAAACPDAEVAALQRGLVGSEERHHRTYVQLARRVAPAAAVAARWEALAAHEAAVLARVAPLPRLHA